MELLKRVLLLSLFFSGYSVSLKAETLQAYLQSYSHCSVERKTLYLTKKQQKQLSGSSIGATVSLIKTKCPTKIERHFLLSDKVRTHYLRAIVKVFKDVVAEVRVVKFDEPSRYKASQKYIDTLKNKKQFEDIDGISGATLTRSSLIRVSKNALLLSSFAE